MLMQSESVCSGENVPDVRRLGLFLLKRQNSSTGVTLARHSLQRWNKVRRGCKHQASTERIVSWWPCDTICFSVRYSIHPHSHSFSVTSSTDLRAVQIYKQTTSKAFCIFLGRKWAHVRFSIKLSFCRGGKKEDCPSAVFWAAYLVPACSDVKLRKDRRLG